MVGWLMGLMQKDMLIVWENTRQNAATRSKPHVLLCPILSLNPEGCRVKFLTCIPLLPHSKNSNTMIAIVILPLMEEEKKCTA
jgi:hypothetical protein